MNMQVSAGVAKDEIVNLVWTELVSNCLGCVINTFHQSFVFWKRQVSNLFDMTVSDQNDSSGMRLVAMKIQSSTGKCANFYQIEASGPLRRRIYSIQSWFFRLSFLGFTLFFNIGRTKG